MSDDTKPTPEDYLEAAGWKYGGSTGEWFDPVAKRCTGASTAEAMRIQLDRAREHDDVLADIRACAAREAGETREEFGFACSTAEELVGQGPIYEGPKR